MLCVMRLLYASTLSLISSVPESVYYYFYAYYESGAYAYQWYYGSTFNAETIYTENYLCPVGVILLRLSFG